VSSRQSCVATTRVITIVIYSEWSRRSRSAESRGLNMSEGELSLLRGNLKRRNKSITKRSFRPFEPFSLLGFMRYGPQILTLS
jgi:hypothetical protein